MNNPPTMRWRSVCGSSWCFLPRCEDISRLVRRERRYATPIKSAIVYTQLRSGGRGRRPRAPGKWGKTMQTMKHAAELKNRGPLLSTLWIFLALNYLVADVYALFFDP